MAEQIKIDIFADSSSIKELKTQLREARDQLSGLEVGSEGFNKVAARAGEIKDQMKDVNEQVAIFAGGSGFEKAGTALRQVKDSIMSLDFQGASEKAKTLTSLVQGISFKEAAGGLKNLGSAFMNLGKALLTNPLFLLAAVIIGIVVALKKVMDAIGVTAAIMKIFGDVMKYIGKIIDDYLIQPLKDLTDWLGITSNAADDSAKKQVEANEELKKSYTDMSNSSIVSLENQIKILKAAGLDTTKEEYRLLGEKRRKVAQDLDLDRDSIKSKQNLIKNSKQLSDEEREELKKDVKALKEKVTENKLAYKSLTGDMTAFRIAKKQDNIDTNNEQAAADKKAAEDRAKAAAAAAKERKATALSVQRELIDIGLSFLEDGQNKEEAILREGYKRKIEDTLNNEKYTAAQKQALVLALKDQEEQQLGLITDKYIKIEKDKKIEAEKKEAERINNLRLKDLEDLNNLLLEKEQLENSYLDSKLSKEDQEINKVRDKYTAIIEAAKKAGEDITVLEAAQAAEITKIQKDEAEKRIALEESVMSAKFKIAQDTISLISNVTELFGRTNEANAKKAFYVEKALGVSSATIAGIEGTIQAYKTAQKSPITAVFPAYPAIQAGLAAAFAAVNIAKIAATPFGGGGQKASAPNSGSVTTPAQPSFQLIGQANEGNVVQASGNDNINQNINVNATVSVEQITDTQKKLAQIKQSKTL